MKDVPLDDPWVRNYDVYLDTLNARSLPIVINLTHLAQHIDLDVKLLSYLCAKPEKQYRVFDIPKRRGGFREILAPSPELLTAQRWILEKILENLYISKNCHSFTKKKSIITNAKAHLGAEKILKMDLKNFFPSINQKRIISLFRSIGYTRKISIALSQICCLNQYLPQGAATSPSLSNLVCYNLDLRLIGISQKFDLTYTRYADDLTFSGKKIGKSTSKIIEKIANNEGFEVNQGKTLIVHKNNQKKIITGLSISNDKITIPKKKKREIRSEVHNFLHKNQINQSFDHFQPYAKDRILGLLNFWLQVEPDNIYAHRKIVEVQATN